MSKLTSCETIPNFSSMLSHTGAAETNRNQLILDLAQQKSDENDNTDIPSTRTPKNIGSSRQDQVLPSILDKDLDLPTILQRRLQPREFTFVALQEWEGYVIRIGSESFTARLMDLTNPGEYEDDEGEFPLSDLSDNDLQLLEVGAIFRWAIGYQRSRGGTKKRTSQIVFRQLPQWTEKELHNNREKAKELATLLRGE